MFLDEEKDDSAIGAAPTGDSGAMTDGNAGGEGEEKTDETVS